MLIEIDPMDAAIVKAILLTHAAMQEKRVMDNEVIQTRLMRDEPGTPMIAMLAEQVVAFEEDSEELRRISEMFPALPMPVN